jgi:cell division protein FtsZ
MAQRLRAQVAAKQVTPEPVMPLIRAAPVEDQGAALPLPAEAPLPVATLQDDALLLALTQASAAPAATAPQPVHAAETAQVIAAEPASPVIRPARLPQIEDFPVVAQNQLRAALSPSVQPLSPETKRMTLLQRLAAVGLGRRDEIEPVFAAPAAPLPPAQARAPAPQPVRAAAGQLDSHGRQQPRSIEDDQLEIPAFLRRQVS